MESENAVAVVAQLMSTNPACLRSELARTTAKRSVPLSVLLRASADLKHAAFVDISCATTATAFADSTEINLAIYR